MDEKLKENLKEVKKYFEEVNIILPKDVDKAIEEAFSSIETNSDVECYVIFKNDSEELLELIEATQVMNLTKTSEYIQGDYTNYYTFYGEFNPVINEKIKLDDIYLSEVEYDDKPQFNEDDFLVFIKERNLWDSTTNQSEEDITVVIYVPEEMTDEE